MSKTKHTATPWKVNDSTENTINVVSPWSDKVTESNFKTFADYRGAHICEMHYNTGTPSKEQAEANAERIVHCVNNYDNLLFAVKELEKVLDHEGYPESSKYLKIVLNQVEK